MVRCHFGKAARNKIRRSCCHFRPVYDKTWFEAQYTTWRRLFSNYSFIAYTLMVSGCRRFMAVLNRDNLPRAGGRILPSQSLGLCFVISIIYELCMVKLRIMDITWIPYRQWEYPYLGGLLMISFKRGIHYPASIRTGPEYMYGPVSGIKRKLTSLN
jgi:hypothetical protein